MGDMMGLYDDFPCKNMSSFVTLLLLLWKLFSTIKKAGIITENTKINIRGADFRGEKRME